MKLWEFRCDTLRDTLESTGYQNVKLSGSDPCKGKQVNIFSNNAEGKQNSILQTSLSP